MDPPNPPPNPTLPPTFTCLICYEDLFPLQSQLKRDLDRRQQREFGDEFLTNEEIEQKRKKEEEEGIVVSLSCGHTFHKGCITKAFEVEIKDHHARAARIPNLPPKQLLCTQCRVSIRLQPTNTGMVLPNGKYPIAAFLLPLKPIEADEDNDDDINGDGTGTDGPAYAIALTKWKTLTQPGKSFIILAHRARQLAECSREVYAKIGQAPEGMIAGLGLQELRLGELGRAEEAVWRGEWEGVVRHQGVLEEWIEEMARKLGFEMFQSDIESLRLAITVTAPLASTIEKLHAAHATIRRAYTERDAALTSKAQTAAQLAQIKTMHDMQTRAAKVDHDQRLEEARREHLRREGEERRKATLVLNGVRRRGEREVEGEKRKVREVEERNVKLTGKVDKTKHKRQRTLDRVIRYKQDLAMKNKVVREITQEQDRLKKRLTSLQDRLIELDIAFPASPEAQANSPGQPPALGDMPALDSFESIKSLFDTDASEAGDDSPNRLTFANIVKTANFNAGMPPQSPQARARHGRNMREQRESPTARRGNRVGGSPLRGNGNNQAAGGGSPMSLPLRVQALQASLRTRQRPARRSIGRSPLGNGGAGRLFAEPMAQNQAESPNRNGNGNGVGDGVGNARVRPTASKRRASAMQGAAPAFATFSPKPKAGTVAAVKARLDNLNRRQYGTPPRTPAQNRVRTIAQLNAQRLTPQGLPSPNLNAAPRYLQPGRRERLAQEKKVKFAVQNGAIGALQMIMGSPVQHVPEQQGQGQAQPQHQQEHVQESPRGQADNQPQQQQQEQAAQH